MWIKEVHICIVQSFPVAPKNVWAAMCFKRNNVIIKNETFQVVDEHEVSPESALLQVTV